MYSIEARLLHTPIVYKNHEILTFPFKKAEALFYYLLVQKQATRDELVNLLWGDVEEETAKKNLRHAMYKIRKTFDMEIIISPQKSLVILNPEIEIEADYDAFIQGKDESYGGDFLQGFSVKEGEVFEEWMLRTRDTLRDTYVNRLHKTIEEELDKEEYDLAEEHGKLLIELEPFDEKAYRMLMRIYGERDSYHKVLELYQKLREILNKELGIDPDEETKKVYEEILQKRALGSLGQRKKNESFFFGRERELKILRDQYQTFISNRKSSSMLILGEAGVGKTRLAQKFLEELEKSKINIIRAYCYQAEESYPLKPWNPIFSSIAEIMKSEGITIPPYWKNIIVQLFPNFDPEGTMTNVQPGEQIDRLKYQVAEEIILNLFKKIGKKKKLLLVFEDLQWMDSASLSLLNHMLLHQEDNNILLVATCRNEGNQKIEQFAASLMKYDRMEKLELARFSQKEAEAFIEQVLPYQQMTKELKEKIYRETEGNPFFLVEFLNTVREKGDIGKLSPKAQDIVKSRFLDLAQEEMKILNIASLFFDKVKMEFLRVLSGKDELEILDIVEELQRRYLLRETEDEEISFEFTHQKLREFIYFNQSPARRKILHHRIGMILEESLKNDWRDRLTYSKLIYHFAHGGSPIEALKYRIKNLDLHSDFSHELFPASFDESMENESGSNHEEVLRSFKEIEEEIKRVREEKTEGEILNLEMAFLHTKGRYLIQEGEYQQGIAAVQEMIQNAEVLGDYVYALKGYRQMIYYGIQIHDTELMSRYLEVGLKLAMKHHQQREIGVLLRLKGLNKLMIGAYEEAEELLKKSIYLFEAICTKSPRYALNIAAAYHYIGEIRRRKMKFSSALSYYEKAMSICSEKRAFRGMTIFNTCAGQAAFDRGDYQQAKKYFQKAITIYGQLDTLVGRATAEGYMALLMIKEGNPKEAVEHLRKAEEYGDRLKSPYELGVLYRVKAEIKINMENHPTLQKIFSKVLDLKVHEYCDKGIQLLEKVTDAYEVEILRVLKKDRR